MHITGNPNLRIGVLDTGIPMQNINLSHDEFPNNGRIILRTSYVVIAKNDVADDRGHSTHVAGIIRAQTHNNTGSAGICFNSKLFISKILNSTNYGEQSLVRYAGVKKYLRGVIHPSQKKLANLML